MHDVVESLRLWYDTCIRGVRRSRGNVVDVRSNFALRTVKPAGPLPL